MKRNEGKAGWAKEAKLLVIALGMATAAVAQTRDMQPHPAEEKRQVVVSIADRKLALLEGGRVRKIYPVAVGARVSPSPRGEFKIVNRVAKPAWYYGGKVVAPGPQNPLGSRWMGLSQKGYGIHGTNAPRSIGKAASHGCIRMAKADLEELFELVQVGDTVEIRDADAETQAIFGAATLASRDNGLGAVTSGGQ